MLANACEERERIYKNMCTNYLLFAQTLSGLKSTYIDRWLSEGDREQEVDRGKVIIIIRAAKNAKDSLIVSPRQQATWTGGRRE